MDNNIREIVAALHSTENMTSLAIAGAGAGAIGWILGVAGASRTVLDIQVPYASSAMIEYIGAEPEQFVSETTSRALARAAYRRAIRLREGDMPVVGLSCTATIATDRPKRGEHRCHVSTYYSTGWNTETLTLTKGLRARDEEDDVVSRLILNALAESFGLDKRIAPGLSPDEEVVPTGHRFGDPLEALVASHVGHVLVLADGARSADAAFSGAILSGSFNPLHRGHTRLLNAASRMLGKPGIFELSISNVDKPDLAVSEVNRRLKQFQGKSDIAVTRVPTFVEKARLFPGATFVIGFDTMTRVIDPKYYGGSENRMNSALSELQDLNSGFLIAGRVIEGVFKTLDDLPLPTAYRDLFTQIPESEFRDDISSTQIRNERP